MNKGAVLLHCNKRIERKKTKKNIGTHPEQRKVKKTKLMQPREKKEMTPNINEYKPVSVRQSMMRYHTQISRHHIQEIS